MSHSSGIPVTKALTEAFGDAVSNQIRFLKVQIVNDELVPVATHPLGTNYEDDLDLVHKYLDEKDPCYILFRLDEKSAHDSYLWVLMCYVPDKAKVRDKMTYASTRANLRRQLGSSSFTSELFGTVPGDFNKNGYRAFVAMQKSESPLTWTERQTNQEKQEGVVGGGTSTAYVHGVAFPVNEDVISALKQLLQTGSNYVQVAIDAEKERIILDHVGDISLDTLADEIPQNDQPRFHFFRYDHEYEGENQQPIVMVYSCPDGSGNSGARAPVKLRMLYSSSKANIENIITTLGGKVAVKLEVNSGSELTSDGIINILHPQKEEEKKNFAKPKGPSKGGKRLIRNTAGKE